MHDDCTMRTADAVLSYHESPIVCSNFIHALSGLHPWIHHFRTLWFLTARHFIVAGLPTKYLNTLNGIKHDIGSLSHGYSEFDCSSYSSRSSRDSFVFAHNRAVRYTSC